LRNACHPFRFEAYTKSFVTGNNNKDVFIVAGTYGTKNVELTAKGDPGTDMNLNQESIKIPEYLWKVILVVNRPGLEAKDITADNAYAIGLWMPNDTATSSQSAWRTQEPDEKYTYLRTVDFIETQTGYDFFSYLSTDVQAALESNFLYNRKYRKPSDFPNGVALLSADVSDNQSLIDDSSGSINAVISGAAIWHSSVTEQSTSIVKTNSTQEISIGQVGIIKEGSFQSGITEVSSSQVGSVETTLPQFSISEISTDPRNIINRSLTSVSTSPISPIEDGSLHANTFNITSSQVSSTQVGISQVNPLKIGSFKISSTEVGSNKTVSTQFSSSEVGSTQIDPTKQSVVTQVQLQPSKVSLPSSVSSQEFFSSDVIHENTSNLLTNIFSTARSIWQSTPINLTFKVTNLPTRQLAEAQVSEFGVNGLPIKATILIDDDANGVGWFLDSTPQENSEFQQGDGNYYIANPNNAAATKYDLLTAILHEMGHTFGIINGYSEFDKHIKSGKFIPTDSPNGAKITLTPDGSHLDSTLYPYDLMNTSLKPGIRKLPSTMDLSILNALWS
jgi:hypothetical protein